MTSVIVTLMMVGGFAQKQIDSLENLLTTLNGDEEKVEVMSSLVDLYGTNPEAELYVKSIVNIGEKAEAEVKASAYTTAYQYYFKTDQYFQARNYANMAIATQQSFGLTSLPDTYDDLGDWFKKNYELDSAIVYYAKAELGFSKYKVYEKLVLTLNKQGIIYKDLTNYGEALQKYYQAYELAKKYDMKKRLASTCVNIGVIFKKQYQLEDAMTYYLEAEELDILLEDHIGLANVYNNIGNVYRINGDFDLALESYKSAIRHRELGGSQKTLSYSYNNMALVYKEKGKYDSTLYFLKVSEDYKVQLNELSSLASTYYNFADTYALINDSVNYQKYFDLAMEYAMDYEDYILVQELHVLASHYESDRGNYKMAYEQLLQVIKMTDTLSKKEQQVLSKVLQAKYNDKKKAELIGELTASIAKQKEQEEELREDESILRQLLTALVILAIILVVTMVTMLRYFKGLKDINTRLESVNVELAKTKIGAEEKELLIKEIHHRVKNNLQVVKSLIRLHKENPGDSLDLLTDFENRVSSIALVHESLYSSIDLTKVDVAGYYKKLINDLIDAYAVGQVIKKEIEVHDQLTFCIDTLIPLGLLTNEIVSNALKHGFRQRSEGTIKIVLQPLEEKWFLLEISDDGIGVGEDFLSRNSLGLELIDTLVGQLDGTKELIVDHGTKYIIKFKNQDKS